MARSSTAAQEEDSDGKAVRAVLDGNTEQYALLVRRYRERYARYAVRILGAIDLAEDAMQEAFIRAYDRLHQCRDPERFSAWFFLILRNSCYRIARAERRREAGPLDQGGDPPAPTRADGPLEAAARQQALNRALGSLTMAQREVFALKHDEGLSYEEIAERTGTPVASLKMRMHRAYDRLRAELKEEP
jgi:RNA polymerase sigma-70 factor (ECF subfamily)